MVDGFFFGWFDSLYWSVTLLLQTPDKAPRTWGGKMVLVAHGWFMLIVIASYTANLASFLTAAEAVPLINRSVYVFMSFVSLSVYKVVSCVRARARSLRACMSVCLSAGVRSLCSERACMRSRACTHTIN